MAAPMQNATSAAYLHESVKNLTTLEDIKKAYDEACVEEEKATDDVNAQLQRQSSLDTKMIALRNTLPNLQLMQGDSSDLASMIGFTSTLAENVSSKVRQLDLAKSRVTLCMQRVEDILDLKFCTDGVQRALQDEDFEKAAAHVHRFLNLDENVLRMSADINEGSTLDTSFKLLHEAQEKLKKIIHRQFDAAVHQGDVASVERFFKVFPLIGEHDEGLAKFSKYLCSKLSASGEKNLATALSTRADDKRGNVVFADTITMLFEGIARVVEIHQPLVETYYGPGKVYIMMQHIQRECDRQVRKITDHFKQNRQFDKRVESVHQSMMSHKQPVIDKLDPKDLDVLLAEITLLNTRSELYLRFVRRRVLNDMESLGLEGAAKTEKLAEVERFVTDCELSRVMQELIGSYIMMEEYFMREMVVKAVSLDVLDDGALTSSMVDDAFFIVKKCVRRALSSSSVDGVCAMLNHANSVLEQDFREVLYAKLRQGFPSGFDFMTAYNLMQSSIQQGKLGSTDVETQKAKTAFLSTLNNAEVSCEYIQTLKENLDNEITTLYSSVTEQAKAKLQSCLSDMTGVVSRFKDVLDFGFSQLNSCAVKPRIKPWTDGFLSVSHNISEDDFTNFEANDPWVQQFIVNVDSLMVTFKNSLTSGNFDVLVSHIANEITSQLEKAVLKTTFNRLGGLQFDKELRSLVGYLSNVTTWTIRDKFARLTQMATILNLEKVSELLDYWGPNSGPLTWRLTPSEVRQVLSLRTDFVSEDIKRLKL